MTQPSAVPRAEYIDNLWMQHRAGKIDNADLVSLQAVYLRTMQPVALPTPRAGMCSRCHVRVARYKLGHWVCRRCLGYELAILRREALAGRWARFLTWVR